MTLLPRRLNLRVILLVSATLCLTGAISGWIDADRESARLKSAMWQHASVMVGNFAQNCSRFLVLQDYAELEGFLLKSAELPDLLNLTVCEPGGRVLSDVRQLSVGRAVARPAGNRIATPVPVALTLGVERGELVVWQPIVAGSLLGWVRAEYSLAGIRRVQAESWEQSAVLALAWIVCSATLVLLALRPTARALNTLAEFARTLNDHKGATVTVGHGAKEIDELEASLNYASQRLADAERQMLADRERLRQSEAMYRSLVMAMAEGVIFQSASGEITAVNPAAEEILGRSAAELLGSATVSFEVAALHEDGTPFPPQSHPAMVSLASAQPQHNVAMGIHRPDGSLAWISVNAQPLVKEGETRPSAVVTTFHDVTRSKSDEEALLYLAAIVESSDDAIIGKSLKGEILSWNRGAERLFGYREAEVKGRSMGVLIPPHRASELDYILKRINEGRAVEHYETERLCRDGRSIDVSVTISPLLDSRGRVVGASTIARDISDRKRAEADLRRVNEELERRVLERTADLNSRGQELALSQRALLNIVEDLNLKTAELEEANVKLKELDRLKSMFVASMSHELRTPLNSIIGFSSVLLDEWPGPLNDEQKENLAIVLRSGKHLLNLINDVIDVSKIEAGKIEALTEEFELEELVAEAMTLVRKDAQDKGLTLTEKILPLTVRADRRRLLQCVLNLVSNAVKFTQKGEVSVVTRALPPGARTPEGAVEIAVTDTGPGISDEDLPRMFQPFVRFAPPGQPSVPGTGLGLYLTRKLACEILNGELTMTSRFGAGCRFVLKIPVR